MAKQKKRSPMPAAERAKQFMPFSAVRGLNTALRRKEHELGLVQPKVMADEAAAELDLKLRSLKKGSQAVITFFQNGEYVQAVGQVLALDSIKRQLALVPVEADGLSSGPPLRVFLADIIDIQSAASFSIV